jgi:predicted nucleic acid-binding protein
MPGVKAFFDTNILLYIHDAGAGPKRGVASHWLASCNDKAEAIINLQCLNEMTQVMLRKCLSQSPTEIFGIADRLSIFGSAPVTMSDIDRARELHVQTRYSWWECLLLASAIGLGCSHFLSEDLEDGQRIGPMTVIDPFKHHPSELLGQPGN